MSYVTVSFEIHEDDLVKGLKVEFLGVPETDELVPFVIGPTKAAVHVEREGDKVSTFLYGGTRSQFEHHCRIQGEYLKRHGLVQGENQHFSKQARHAA